MPTISRRDPLSLQWPEWFGRRMAEMWPDRSSESADTSSIKVEELRGDDSVVIRAELPGIDPDKDVHISIADGLLRIRGQRSAHDEAKQKDYYHSEFRYGSFERILALPRGATDRDVTATYADGVLEVRIPVAAGSADAVEIPVQRPS